MSKIFVQFMISAIQALTFVIIGNLIIGIREMWLSYWLVLFSCWAGANMMGMVISDSFKAVVTIYILIPFLVIPQIILSGIMVKFDKLNPDLAPKAAIPWYGELISARWGYEALAVKQFKDNKYESQLYVFDRAMSKAKFKRNLWCVEVKRHLDLIENDLNKGTRSKGFEDDLKLVYNELKKENLVQKTLNSGLKPFDVEQLTPGNITRDVISSALDHIEMIRQVYIDYYKSANDLKEAKLNKLQSADKAGFLRLKDRHHNKSLEEFVTNKDETKTYIVLRDHIVQRMEPIYMDPLYPFVKAHFYAPFKMVFGTEVPTFAVNVIVLWVMTIGLYIVLYFRLLKRFLDIGEVAMGKKLKGSE